MVRLRSSPPNGPKALVKELSLKRNNTSQKVSPLEEAIVESMSIKAKAK